MRKRTVKKNDLKIYTLDEAKDKLAGKRGTSKREKYEHDLSSDILADAVSYKNPFH